MKQSATGAVTGPRGTGDTLGRKSSAKSPRTPTSPSGPGPDSSSNTIVIASVVALVVLAGGVAYWRVSQPQPEPAAQPVAQTVAEPPAAALLGPHPQPNLPPLPFNPEPPARPPDVVRAAYRFAAEHPEVLSYVPCYCGCEHAGHRGSEDCFVAARNEAGDVTDWEPHGAT